MERFGLSGAVRARMIKGDEARIGELGPPFRLDARVCETIQASSLARAKGAAPRATVNVGPAFQVARLVSARTGFENDQVTCAMGGQGGAGGAELGGGCFDVALPVLAGEHRAATLTPPMRDTPMGWSMGDARL
jgi:hypothetical protein